MKAANVTAADVVNIELHVTFNWHFKSNCGPGIEWIRYILVQMEFSGIRRWAVANAGLFPESGAGPVSQCTIADRAFRFDYRGDRPPSPEESPGA